MTTLKELKELDAKATSAPWSYIDEWSGIYDAPDIRGAQVRIAEIVRTPDYKANVDIITATRNALPDLIRVIELAEDGLRNAQATLRHYRLYDLDKVEQALSEIRKLKGE